MLLPMLKSTNIQPVNEVGLYRKLITNLDLAYSLTYGVLYAASRHPHS